MTRSHTCHDNPLFLWDEKRFCTKLNAKDEENTLDLENNHSTNSVTSNKGMPLSIATKPEENFDNKCNSTEGRNMNESGVNDKCDSMRTPSRNDGVGVQRCVLCELSHRNQNNVNELHGYIFILNYCQTQKQQLMKNI